MIGVGVEELGVEEFVQGKFFDGDLYIDTKKETYQSLGFKRYGIFSGIASIFSSISRRANQEVKRLGIGGNMKGDGFQNGGTIIVSKGGEKCLLKYVQGNPSDHVPFEDVFKALGIEGETPPEPEPHQPNKPEAACKDEVCEVKK